MTAWPEVLARAGDLAAGDAVRCGAVWRAVRAVARRRGGVPRVALTLDGGATLVLPAGARVAVRRAP